MMKHTSWAWGVLHGVNGQLHPDQYHFLQKEAEAKHYRVIRFKFALFPNVKLRTSGGQVEAYKLDLRFLYNQDQEPSDKEIEANIIHMTRLACQPDAAKHQCFVCLEKTKSKCSECRNVYYCSRNCQEINWPIHRAACRVSKNFGLGLCNFMQCSQPVGDSPVDCSADCGSVRYCR